MSINTINVSHDLILIHYGWEDFLGRNNRQTEPKIVNNGLTYISFVRSKTIGNALNLTYMGYMPNIYVGDWIVLKTTGKGLFNTKDISSNDHYSNKGLVRFIGQIHSITSQYNADADGILRKSYNVLIREWSHCLNIPIRYSDEISILSKKETAQTQAVSEQLSKDPNPDKEYIKKQVDSNWKDFISNRLSSFQIIKNILIMIGVRNAFKTDKEATGIPLTTSSLPEIPEKIYKDHVYVLPGEKFSSKLPFNTGFCLSLIGVQSWKGIELKNNLFDVGHIKNIVNASVKRPPAFLPPSIYSQGIVFPETVKSILNTGGEYETYTDIFYFENKNKIVGKPVLVIRDKPISFRSLQIDPKVVGYMAYDRTFGFTYKDDIPRITIPLANILSFSLSYSSQDSYNYLQFMPTPKIQKEAIVVATSYRDGRYKDSKLQTRFGGQEYVVNISEFVSVVDDEKKPPNTKNVKKQTAKDKKASEKKAGTAENAKKSNVPLSPWLWALKEKYKYYFPVKFAMPSCTVQLIDNDFPLSVGLMMRIELGKDKPTLCGQIEEISYTSTINGEGKVSNKTYVKLSDLLMESPDNPKILHIIPKDLSRTLFIDTTQQNIENNQFMQFRPN